MREFWKRPKFWVALIIVLWLAYIIYNAFQIPAVSIHLIPFVPLSVNVSYLILGSGIIGCVLTLVIQALWRRRRASKNASQSAAAPAASSNTAA